MPDPRPPLLADTDLAAMSNHIDTVHKALTAGEKLTTSQVIDLAYIARALHHDVQTLRYRVTCARLALEGRAHRADITP
jgi:hypothetical protein